MRSLLSRFTLDQDGVASLVATLRTKLMSSVILREVPRYRGSPRGGGLATQRLYFRAQTGRLQGVLDGDAQSSKSRGLPIKS